MIFFNYQILWKMGAALQHSRAQDLPANINDKDVRERIINSWTESNILAFPWTKAQKESGSTLLNKTLRKAAAHIATIFLAREVELKILEVFAGNCYASQIIYDNLKSQVISWICTDAIDFNSKPILPNFMKFEQLDAVNAVAKYGQEADVLLLISPPPYSNSFMNKDLGYGDYYACHDYLSKNDESSKYIIFIGELGASDGSEGMYKYLTLHPNLDLIYREMLDDHPDAFGGPGEKELFIFMTK